MDFFSFREKALKQWQSVWDQHAHSHLTHANHLSLSLSVVRLLLFLLGCFF